MSSTERRGKRKPARGTEEIRQELEVLSSRRSELWRGLALGHDAARVAEVTRLNARIHGLWLELRGTRARQRFGPPESILARARVEAHVESELRRRSERRRAGAGA